MPTPSELHAKRVCARVSAGIIIDPTWPPHAYRTYINEVLLPWATRSLKKQLHEELAKAGIKL